MQPSPAPEGESTVPATAGGERATAATATPPPAASGQTQRPAATGGQADPDAGDLPRDAATANDGVPNPDPETGATVLDQERYAIQLISFRSESSVAPFVEEFGILDEARYMHSRNEDQDWYSVFLGIYGTRKAGTAAVATLPPRLRELGPWVRSLPAGTRLIPVDAPSDVASNE